MPLIPERPTSREIRLTIVLGRVGHVDGVPVVVASGIAATVMVTGAVILKGDVDGGGDGDRANVRAVLLDTISDAAAAGGVALTGAIIALTGRFDWLDPAVALIIAAGTTQVQGVAAQVKMNPSVSTVRARPPG